MRHLCLGQVEAVAFSKSNFSFLLLPCVPTLSQLIYEVQVSFVMGDAGQLKKQIKQLVLTSTKGNCRAIDVPLGSHRALGRRQQGGGAKTSHLG